EAAQAHPQVYIRHARGGVTRLGQGFASALSPDSRSALLISEDHKVLSLVPIGGGKPMTLPESGLSYQWVKYLPDGIRLLALAHRLRSYTDLPARILRIHTRTGETKPWRDISPADPIGVNSVTGVSIARDERSYAYSYRRILSELYLVEGWL